MKKQLRLFVAIIGLLSQSPLIYCAQQQGWSDWFRSKYQQYSGTAAEAQKSLASGVAAVRSRVERAAAPSVAAYRDVWSDEPDNQYKVMHIDEEKLGKIGATALRLGFSYVIIGPSLLLTTASLINDLANDYITRPQAIAGIKNNLKIAVADNALLYPTRSSKIHVLLKKDEFLQYAPSYFRDTNGIFDEACSQLSKEIQDSYTQGLTKAQIDAQRAEDSQIDSHVATLRKAIASEQSLEGKIKALELVQDQQKSIIQMRAYLSLYYRLKNQLEVEKQSAARKKQTEETFATKKVVPTPPARTSSLPVAQPTGK
jgi:hypothetical protein